VPKDLHDRGEVHARFVEDRPGGVATAFVLAAVLDSGFFEQFFEFLPVVARVYRPAVRAREERAVFLPLITSASPM
jgi:hypothetical protein